MAFFFFLSLFTILISQHNTQSYVKPHISSRIKQFSKYICSWSVFISCKHVNMLCPQPVHNTRIAPLLFHTYNPLHFTIISSTIAYTKFHSPLLSMSTKSAWTQSGSTTIVPVSTNVTSVNHNQLHWFDLTGNLSTQCHFEKANGKSVRQRKQNVISMGLKMKYQSLPMRFLTSADKLPLTYAHSVSITNATNALNMFIPLQERHSEISMSASLSYLIFIVET